jgi:hypothetical protein
LLLSGVGGNGKCAVTCVRSYRAKIRETSANQTGSGEYGEACKSIAGTFSIGPVLS